MEAEEKEGGAGEGRRGWAQGKNAGTGASEEEKKCRNRHFLVLPPHPSSPPHPLYFPGRFNLSLRERKSIYDDNRQASNESGPVPPPWESLAR